MSRDEASSLGLTEWEHAAIGLLACKCVRDYRKVGGELESFYEFWSKIHVSCLKFRSLVWKCTLKRLAGQI